MPPLRISLSTLFRPIRKPHYPEFLVNPGTAIGAATSEINLLNYRQELIISNAAFAKSARLSGIVTRPGHTVKPAHDLYLVFFPVLLNESRDFCLRSEQNRMAFFNRACSSLRIAYSFSSCRRRFSSVTLAGVSMAGLPSSIMRPSRYSLRQRESING